MENDFKIDPKLPLVEVQVRRMLLLLLFRRVISQQQMVKINY